MTQADFVSMLQTAQRVENYYNNTGGHNLGQFDGKKYSFDCWNLIKAILSGWSPNTPTQRPLVTGDVGGEKLLNDCGVKFGQLQDFSKLSIPGTYLYMNGHAGTYIGDLEIGGKIYNVIECTAWSARGHDLGDSGVLQPVNYNSDGTPKGVIYTYITSTGQRRAYKDGRIGGQWANYGLLPWVEYTDNYQPDTVIEYNGTIPVYSAKPTTTAEYIARRQELEPRLSAPVLASSAIPIFEDDSHEATYQTNVTVNGVVTSITHYKQVKYDGRDLWYVPTSQGGWSPFEEPLDNASYAWCRFSEAMDGDPNNRLIGHIGCQLSRGLAIDFYRHDEDGYTRNVACAPGAVMCFYSKSKPGKGYVCIVEKMSQDGVIVTSEYVNGGFRLVSRQKRYGFWDFDDWVFQGFIHNPICALAPENMSALESFCQVAEDHVGDSISWIIEQAGIRSNEATSASLIVAVAKVAGSTLNIIIPNTTSVTAIGRIGVLQDMGVWIEGRANNRPGMPKVGDIVIFRNNKYKKPSTYQGDIAGIVISVGTSKFDVVHVDNGRIVKQSYSTSFSRVAGFFRPDWDRIDGTSDSVRLYRNLHGLYTSGVVVEDACAREIGYVKNNLPSIKRTDIRLSAINYTGLLSNMYTVFATSSTSDAADTDLIVDLWTSTLKSWFQEGGIRLTTDSATVISAEDADNIEGIYASVDTMLRSTELPPGVTASNINICGNARKSFEYLTTQAGLSPAAACGVCANIQSESSFNCGAKGDYMWKCLNCGTWNASKYNICQNKDCGKAQGSAAVVPTSFGICQWHHGRGDRMKAFAGADWENNLTGQLGYLMSELQGGYSGVLNALRLVNNDVYGACYAADVFVRKFEVPAYPDKASAARQAHALTFWINLVQ